MRTRHTPPRKATAVGGTRAAAAPPAMLGLEYSASDNHANILLHVSTNNRVASLTHIPPTTLLLNPFFSSPEPFLPQRKEQGKPP